MRFGDEADRHPRKELCRKREKWHSSRPMQTPRTSNKCVKRFDPLVTSRCRAGDAIGRRGPPIDRDETRKATRSACPKNPFISFDRLKASQNLAWNRFAPGRRLYTNRTASGAATHVRMLPELAYSAPVIRSAALRVPTASGRRWIPWISPPSEIKDCQRQVSLERRNFPPISLKPAWPPCAWESPRAFPCK